MAAPLFIGIDAGGSKTEVLARRGTEEVSEVGQGTNLRRDGVDHTADVLSRAVGKALRTLGSDGLGAICLGVAGAGRDDEQADLASAVRHRLGDPAAACPILVEHDGRIALEAAFGEGSGLVVVVGTGSLVLGRTEDGTLLRAGGWGPHIGDEGSGVALGCAAASAVADDFDGGEPTVLRQRFADRYDIATPDDLIRAVYGPNWRPQDVAPLVVTAAQTHDWVSTRILKTQTNALAQRARWLAARADDTLTPTLALMGGLTTETYYRESLAEALLRYLPGWRIVRPEHRPAHGALALAERTAG